MTDESEAENHVENGADIRISEMKVDDYSIETRLITTDDAVNLLNILDEYVKYYNVYEKQ
jgi:hypothetical protein